MNSETYGMVLKMRFLSLKKSLFAIQEILWQIWFMWAYCKKYHLYLFFFVWSRDLLSHRRIEVISARVFFTIRKWLFCCSRFRDDGYVLGMSRRERQHQERKKNGETDVFLIERRHYEGSKARWNSSIENRKITEENIRMQNYHCL